MTMRDLIFVVAILITAATLVVFLLHMIWSRKNTASGEQRNWWEGPGGAQRPGGYGGAGGQDGADGQGAPGSLGEPDAAGGSGAPDGSTGGTDSSGGFDNHPK